MKSLPIIALHELRISIEPDGILVMLFKYAVTCTGKNYIPQMVSDDLYKQGFNSTLSSRVKIDEIMQVKRTGMHDLTAHIGRSIYYLDGQQDEAKKLVKNSLETTINRMKDQMDKVHAAWLARTPRPRRPRPGSEDEKV